MTSTESYRKVGHMQHLLRCYGFIIKDTVNEILTVAVDNKKYPGYVENAVLGRFNTVEEVIAFLNGWGRHVEYVDLGGRYTKKGESCPPAKPASKTSKKNSTTKDTARNAGSTSTPRTRSARTSSRRA